MQHPVTTQDRLPLACTGDMPAPGAWSRSNVAPHCASPGSMASCWTAMLRQQAHSLSAYTAKSNHCPPHYWHHAQGLDTNIDTMETQGSDYVLNMRHSSVGQTGNRQVMAWIAARRAIFLFGPRLPKCSPPGRSCRGYCSLAAAPDRQDMSAERHPRSLFIVRQHARA